MKAKEMNAPINYADSIFPYNPTDWLPYPEMQALRKRLDNVLQDLIKETHQPSESAQESKEILLFLHPADSIKALDKILDKRKDAIRIVNEMFPAGLFMELSGLCQHENILTILSALEELTKIGYRICPKDYLNGFADVCKLTGLMGRWQKVHSYPDIICDTGHNVDGIKYVCGHLYFLHQKFNQELHIVFGMVNDKDISSVLQELPKDATYYFTKASVKRALPENELLALAEEAGLKGTTYPTVVEAVQAAKKNCPPKDLIFVGGSSFIVADLLANRDTLNLY